MIFLTMERAKIKRALAVMRRNPKDSLEYQVALGAVRARVYVNLKASRLDK